MPMRPKNPPKTSLGVVIYGNPGRVEFAAETLRKKNYPKTRDAIMKQFGVSRATAERDIAKAKRVIAAELDAHREVVRAYETRRNERVADRAEELAGKAATEKQWAAAAALQRAAIAASREVSRLNGAYAPAKIEVMHSTHEPSLQLDAILGILDEAGHAALGVVLSQIEAAKAEGRLKPLEPPSGEAEDAEFTDNPARPGEN